MKLYGNAIFSDVTSEMTEFSPAAPVTTDAVITALYSINNLAYYPQYSALHYQQGEVNVGCTYNFTPALYMTAQGGFKIFGDIIGSKSSAPYGDQSGTVYSGIMGVGYKF